MKKIFSVFFIMLITLSAGSCILFDEEADAFCTDYPMSVQTLDTRTVELDGTEYEYLLLKLTAEGCEPSYAQFFPPLSGEKSPCRLQTMPYDVIDWTWEGEDIVEAIMAGDGKTDPDSMIYLARSHLSHGIGALFVYGRFYRGGSIINDVNDMLCGLKFLEQEDLADNDKIGVSGGSWGGFEALYACAYAPSNIRPLAAAINYPVSDFEAWYDYAAYPENYISDSAKISQYRDFFTPYIERIEKSTGGAPAAGGADFSDFRLIDLEAALDTDILIIHDAWDTLVPVTGTEALYAALPELVAPMIFYHESAIDYNSFELSHMDLLTDGSDAPAYLTWMYIYLYTALAGEGQDIMMIYDADRIDAFCDYVKKYDDLGYEVGWAADRFLEMFDDRITLYEINNGTYDKASDVMTASFNAAWGSSYSASELESLLQTGLP